MKRTTNIGMFLILLLMTITLYDFVGIPIDRTILPITTLLNGNLSQAFATCPPDTQHDWHVTLNGTCWTITGVFQVNVAVLYGNGGASNGSGIAIREFNTTPGTLYTLTFLVARAGNGGTIQTNYQVFDTTTNTILLNFNQGIGSASKTFTALGNVTTIKFTDTSINAPSADLMVYNIIISPPEPIATNTPSPTFTTIPSDTPTLIPTETFTAIPTDTPTLIPTETFTAIPTDTPTLVQMETSTQIPTALATQSDTETPTLTLTPTPSETPSPTESSIQIPSDTPSPTFTETSTANTPIPSDTSSPTSTIIPNTSTPIPTNTPFIPSTPIVTSIATNTEIPTISLPTLTDTETPLPTFTLIPTSTPTLTFDQLVQNAVQATLTALGCSIP